VYSDGSWKIDEKVLIGTGWQASADPLNTLTQKRSLVIASDGMSALYQDMGADTSVQAPTMDKEEIHDGCGLKSVKPRLADGWAHRLSILGVSAVSHLLNLRSHQKHNEVAYSVCLTLLIQGMHRLGGVDHLNIERE
jgi:hypothetical protein